MLFDIPGADDGWFGEIADLIPLVTHLQPPVGFTPIQFNRFSEYHREPERHGLRLVPEAMYAFAYPVKATDLTELAYYFADHNRDAATAWRPGLARLATAVREWQALARDSAETHRVTLTACDQDGALVIDDTRPCAVAPRTVLSGLASTVYRRCHKPTAFADLLAHLQNDGPLSPSEAEVRAAVDDLSLRRLLLACSGKLLSLALRAPVRPFLPKRRYLFGTQVQPRLLV
jgi:magnesium-protoporphyrin IX monomethyl ester (oxidative) cyclase